MHSGLRRDAVGASERGGNSEGGINGDRRVVTNCGGTGHGEFGGEGVGSDKGSGDGVNGETDGIWSGTGVFSESGREFVEDINRGIGTAGCANVVAVIGRDIVTIG